VSWYEGTYSSARSRKSEGLANDHSQPARWLAPEAEQQGLKRYLETIRERWLLIVLAVAVTTLAAVVYAASAQKSYEAHAQLLVTPVSRDNEALLVLGLLRDSNDPTRDVQTASLLVTSTDVAELAKEKLGTDRGARSLLDDVSAAPVAQSNIVTVTGKSSDPDEAKRIANAFAESVVEDRDRELQVQVNSELQGLRGTLGRSSGSAASAIARQIALLEALRSGGDPTIQVDTLADTGSKSWPRTGLIVFAGFFAGLVLGLGAAFAAALFDPRLRRESQLRRRFRLPMLARVPDAGRVVREGGVITPDRMPPASAEAHRALRATLSAAAERRELDSPHAADEGHAVFITGSTTRDGRTTTALNLAVALVHVGKRVALIEADLRRPALARALGIAAGGGLPAVLLDEVQLDEALVDAPGYDGKLKLLLTGEPRAWMADQLSLPAGRAIVQQARRLADYVIVDSPPIPEVVDPLPLIEAADDVVIVTRLGQTHLGRLEQLGELLAQAGVTPDGIVLIGAGPRDGGRSVAWGRIAPSARRRAAEREPLLRS
jgi:Mrp family chromosome partitioning ATPase/capsular polysaccharide biosynthesis protein